MNGELAQLVALVSHANAWLGGDRTALAEVGPASTPFQWVAGTTFTAPDGRVDADAAGWAAGLRARGIDRLRLVLPAPGVQTSGGLSVDDRMLAGFANAGRQWVLATGAVGGDAEAWVGEWSLGDREREDRRIWSVAYRGAHLDDVPALADVDVVTAAAALDAALVSIAAFATGQDEHTARWAEVFEAARVAEPSPDLVLLAASAPVAARRLAARAGAAWVFGGMGSWNDLGFDGEAGDRYAAVSAELYRCVLEATAAAANATGPQTGA